LTTPLYSDKTPFYPLTTLLYSDKTPLYFLTTLFYFVKTPFVFVEKHNILCFNSVFWGMAHNKNELWV